MKTDRLIGILTVLLQKGRVAAPYLAEKFEVSRRTINRDVEDLCRAGIPLITLRGSGGGIAIAEGYRIDRTLFTPEALRAVLAGLAGLDSVRQDRRYQQLMDKFSPGRDGAEPSAPCASTSPPTTKPPSRPKSPRSKGQLRPAPVCALPITAKTESGRSCWRPIPWFSSGPAGMSMDSIMTGGTFGCSN